MTQKNHVLGILYESENNALYSGTSTFLAKLSQEGFKSELLDLRNPDNFQALYSKLGSGECAFAFGIQGIGSQLSFKDQNLWEAAKVPFISIHYDHPSHAVTNHSSASAYIANLYSYDTFLYDYQHYVWPIRSQPRISKRIKIDSCRTCRDQTPFEKREIKILYMKTGVSLAPYEYHINTLPKLLREGVWDRIATARKDPNLSLCDLACSLFPKETFADFNNQVEFWAIVKAMDLYLRADRALTFVNWLKFQEGAVIVGNGWDEIDKEGARCIFKPSMSELDAYHLYLKTQFLCNTNPYGRDMVHERILHGLANESIVITDTNAWIDQNLGKAPSLIRFNWAESLDDQILPFIAQGHHGADAAEQSHEIVRSCFPENDGAKTILQAVDDVRSLTRTDVLPT